LAAAIDLFGAKSEHLRIVALLRPMHY